MSLQRSWQRDANAATGSGSCCHRCEGWDTATNQTITAYRVVMRQRLISPMMCWESGYATCVPCSWSRPTSTGRRVRCSEALTLRRRSRRSPSSTRCRQTTSLHNVLTDGSTASATNARSCSYRQRLTMSNENEVDKKRRRCATPCTVPPNYLDQSLNLQSLL